MNTATLKWLTRHLEAACAIGALVLAGELQAQDFTYTNTNGTITITGYTGPGGDVVIPGTIDGLPVTSIGDGALSFINNLSDQSNLTGLSNMTSVTIPDGVTNLGEGAFAGCPNLATITIGKGITSIKGGAGTSSWGTFQWCSSLTRVTIPDNVTNIGDGVGTRGGPFGAFSGCDSLTNFIVGKGLAYLGDGTFTYSVVGDRAMLDVPRCSGIRRCRPPTEAWECGRTNLDSISQEHQTSQS